MADYRYSKKPIANVHHSPQTPLEKKRIRKLIAAENTQKPHSDSRLAELLAAEGIQVARRTVAKYREAMSIPSSTDRKRIG